MLTMPEAKATDRSGALAVGNATPIDDSATLAQPAIGECVQQLGRHDNKEVVVT